MRAARAQPSISTRKSTFSQRASASQQKVKTIRRGGRQSVGRQVDPMDAEGVLGRVAVVGRRPAVAAPMDHGRRQHLDAQGLAGRHRADLVVEAPGPQRRRRLAFDVALGALRRHVEDGAVAQRAQQLDVLGMRPDQRHGAAGRAAARQLACRGRSAPSHTCSGSRPPPPAQPSSVASRRAASSRSPRGELVMGAFAGQQGPGAADAGAVEGRAVGVLAIAVAGVAVPDRALRQVAAQQGVDDLDGVDDARIVGRPQPEADQRQGVGADDRGCRAVVAISRRAVLDRHEAVLRRGRVGDVRRRDAHVIAVDAELAAQASVPVDVGPALDLVVPGSRRCRAGRLRGVRLAAAFERGPLPRAARQSRPPA